MCLIEILSYKIDVKRTGGEGEVKPKHWFDAKRVVFENLLVHYVTCFLLLKNLTFCLRESRAQSAKYTSSVLNFARTNFHAYAHRKKTEIFARIYHRAPLYSNVCAWIYFRTLTVTLTMSFFTKLLFFRDDI